MILARFKAVLVEESGQGREFLGCENRFDRAGIRPAADQRAVSPLAENKI